QRVRGGGIVSPPRIADGGIGTEGTAAFARHAGRHVHGAGHSTVAAIARVAGEGGLAAVGGIAVAVAHPRRTVRLADLVDAHASGAIDAVTALLSVGARVTHRSAAVDVGLHVVLLVVHAARSGANPIDAGIALAIGAVIAGLSLGAPHGTAAPAIHVA